MFSIDTKKITDTRTWLTSKLLGEINVNWLAEKLTVNIDEPIIIPL